ncbi:hypothetical protein M3Y99_01481300 [Aphelenchoides fujianensis]|nr:hypothetical protein M3Y99_01481300 [Aphelenchoides fujianensis]
MSSNLANTLESDEQSVPHDVVERRDEDTPVPPQRQEVEFGHHSTPASQKSARLSEPPAVVQRRPTTGDSGFPPGASSQSTISSHRITTPSPVHPPRRSPLLPLGNLSPAGFLSHHAAQHSTPKSASLGGAYLYGVPGFKPVHQHAKINQLADMLVQATAQLEAEMGLMRELRAQCQSRIDTTRKLERAGWCAQTKMLDKEITHALLMHEMTKMRLQTTEEEADRYKLKLAEMQRKLDNKSRELSSAKHLLDKAGRQNAKLAVEIERMKEEKQRSAQIFEKNVKQITQLHLENNRLKRELGPQKKKEESLSSRPSRILLPSHQMRQARRAASTENRPPTLPSQPWIRRPNPYEEPNLTRD